MNAKTRRRLAMGARALLFSRNHPDPSPGYAAAVARLENRLAWGRELLAHQRDGILEVRRGATLKRELRHSIRRAHLAHLSQVARIAARDVPQLDQKFRLRRGALPYLEFRKLARTMAADRGRAGHLGASAELDRVADEVVVIVAVMDRLNRVRFVEGSELLAAWESASNVVAAPRRSARHSKMGENPVDDLPPAA